MHASQNGRKVLRRSIIILLMAAILTTAAMIAASPAEGAGQDVPSTHTIKQGETLWIVSRQYGISLERVQAANPGINPLNLLPGQKISLNPDKALPSRGGKSNTGGLSSQEIDLMARLVHSEAAGEPYRGQVAVAASVLNRVESSIYPNTVSGVIYQVAYGYYQYSPVLDGRINLPADRSAYRAVYEALSGSDPSNNALGFYNPAKTSNQWVRSQPVTTAIGNHVFFR